MKPLLAALFLLVAVDSGGAQSSTAARPHEPIVGLPCDGCEEVFEGVPNDLAAIARIAPPDEAGEPMRIVGTVLDRSGKPAPGVIVYAYHTDVNGIYPRDIRSRHGRLRGWAKSDESGGYRFDTIRPAAYPNSDIPAHVHMHVIEVDRCAYYLDDLLFDDDPRLSPEKRSRMVSGRGGNGLAVPRRGADGVWIVTRDIRLGERVPGYDQCDRSAAGHGA